MTIDKTIHLLKDVLDISLDLQLLYLKNINNISSLDNKLNPILKTSSKYYDNFIKFILNSKEGYVYYITDLIFGNFIIICINKKNKDYLILGPFLTIKSYDYTLFDNYNEYNINSKDIDTLKYFHQKLPIVSINKISNIIKIIIKNVYSDDYKFEFIEKNLLVNIDKSKIKIPTNSVDTLDYKYLEENSMLEQKLFWSIRFGDKFSALKFSEKLFPYLNINSNDLSSIRQYKNKLIYYNALLKKAAELEHIQIIYLESLYTTYLNNIENLNDFNELHNLLSNMVLNYCSAVSKYKLKGYSPLVKNSINYINLNLSNSLSVQDIANLFYVSPTYLSRVFKKEVNCSIIEYINKERIKRSTVLLRDTDLQIHNISYLVGVDDFNYFSRLFKKHMGKTPSQYRKDNS